MGRLRIVAGRYGGRGIAVPPGEAVRPTREMVREAWFSALGEAVREARVLDLFAGSGALGIEALSRGASSVVFVESDRRCAAVIEENLLELEVGERGRLVRSDVASFLARLDEGERYDIALADPPYGSGWPARIAETFAARPFARLLCVEHRTGALEGVEEAVWSRGYGDTALTFLAPRGDGGRDREDEAGREEPE